MNNLQKQFIYVPTAYCATFRAYHMIGGAYFPQSQPETDYYYSKIAFLEDNKELVTHGDVYGASGGGGGSDVNIYAGQNASYITVTSSGSSYTVGANIISLQNAIGMTYDSSTGQWSPAPDPTSENHGLADVVDLVREIVDDEKVIAAALNNHEDRLNNIDTTTSNISVNSGDQVTLTVSQTQGAIAYTLTPQVGPIANDAYTLVTGKTVYEYIGDFWEEYSVPVGE